MTGSVRRAPSLSGTRAQRKTSPLQTRSEEHTSELQSRLHFVCRLLLENNPVATLSAPVHQPAAGAEAGRALRVAVSRADDGRGAAGLRALEWQPAEGDDRPIACDRTPS